MFASCYSLRKLPDLSWFDGKEASFSGSNSIYQRIVRDCHSLDEIVDLPVLKCSYGGSGFNMGIQYCYRIKEMTFKTGTDSAPRTDSGWNN